MIEFKDKKEIATYLGYGFGSNSQQTINGWLLIGRGEKDSVGMKKMTKIDAEKIRDGYDRRAKAVLLGAYLVVNGVSKEELIEFLKGRE